MTPRHVVALCIATSLLTAAAPARAQQPPPPTSITGDPRLDQEFLDLVRRASARYNQAQLNEALELFQAAYRLYPDTRLLYNMALIFERQERTEEALKHYRRFVSAPGLPEELRVRTRERISRLESSNPSQSKPNPSAPLLVTDTPSPTPPPPAPQEEGVTVAASVVGALGLIGLGGGGALLWSAAQESAALEASPPPADAAERERARRTKRIGAAALLTTGVALTGLSVYLFTRDSGASAALQLAPGEVSAMLIWRF